MTGPVIVVDDVTLRYGVTTVLDHITLEVAAGEVLAVVGPSGAGKSSIVRLVLGLTEPTDGTIHVEGALASSKGRILVAPELRNLAVVFQDLALWPHLTVHGNVSFGLEAARVPKATRTARIDAALGRVGLADRQQAYPGELSGGEQQRVAIARALVLDPCAVLLDEPLANLDVVLQNDLLATLRGSLREHNSAAVYVTHSPREAEALADRVLVIEHGQVAQQGTFAELRRTPRTPFVAAFVAVDSVA